MKTNLWLIALISLSACDGGLPPHYRDCERWQNSLDRIQHCVEMKDCGITTNDLEWKEIYERELRRCK